MPRTKPDQPAPGNRRAVAAGGCAAMRPVGAGEDGLGPDHSRRCRFARRDVVALRTGLALRTDGLCVWRLARTLGYRLPHRPAQRLRAAAGRAHLRNGGGVCAPQRRGGDPAGPRGPLLRGAVAGGGWLLRHRGDGGPVQPVRLPGDIVSRLLCADSHGQRPPGLECGVPLSCDGHHRRDFRADRHRLSLHVDRIPEHAGPGRAPARDVREPHACRRSRFSERRHRAQTGHVSSAPVAAGRLRSRPVGRQCTALRNGHQGCRLCPAASTSLGVRRGLFPGEHAARTPTSRPRGRRRAGWLTGGGLSARCQTSVGLVEYRPGGLHGAGDRPGERGRHHRRCAALLQPWVDQSAPVPCRRRHRLPSGDGSARGSRGCGQTHALDLRRAGDRRPEPDRCAGDSRLHQQVDAGVGGDRPPALVRCRCRAGRLSAHRGLRLAHARCLSYRT